MISVVTPSFRQLDWLQLCIASVADQNDVAVEHIVQDGGTEGIETVLAQAPVRLFVEKDEGMYDAINRGLAKAQGEVCAYLNCDEQYLPGALAEVEGAFMQRKSIDILLAGSIVVDGEGHYLCSRPALKPSVSELRTGRMYNLTSSIFFRATLFRENELLFNPALKIVGDRDWLLRAMESGARVATLDRFTSIFSDLGTNLALSPQGLKETNEGIRRIGLARTGWHRLRRLFAGHYHLPATSYSIYTRGDLKHRRTFEVEKPTGVWRNRI